jgi:hypothetical protein
MPQRNVVLDVGSGADTPAAIGSMKIARYYPGPAANTWIFDSWKTYTLKTPARSVPSEVGEYYWFATIDPKGTPMLAQIPAGVGDILYKDLVPLDPESMDPMAHPTPAWAAAMAEAIVDAAVVGDDLVIEHMDGSTDNVGNVRGPTGATGATGPTGAPGGSDSGFATFVAGPSLTATAVTAKADSRIKTAKTDPYAIQRIDRQASSKARAGGGAAAINYADATELTKDWTDLSGWAASSNAQVASNRLYSVNGTSPAGVLKGFPVAANERAHITTILHWKAGGGSSVPIYFGLDFDTADHAPVTNSPWSVLIGLNGSGVITQYVGGSAAGASPAPIATAGAMTIGSSPSVDTDFAVSIDVNDYYISFSIRKVGVADNFYTFYLRRSLITDAGKGINNIVAYVVDPRGTSGHSVGPVAAVKSSQPTRSKTIASQTVEGVEHRHVVDAAFPGADAWRYALPANYDPRKPSPLVLYMHQSLTGTQHTAWSETRMQPVSDALGDAGYIVAAAADFGDRWGNQASLDNYLALYNFLRDRYNVGPLYLLGISMGGLPALNALAQRKFPTPAAAAFVGGVCDLDVLYANATYTAAIKTAFGVAADGSDYDAKTAGFNPIDREGWELRGVPARFYTSTGDSTVPKGTNCDPMAAKILPFAPEANVVLGSGGHLDASQFQASDLLAFFESYR